MEMDVDTFLVSLLQLRRLNQQKIISRREKDARRRWRTYLRRRRFVSMLFGYFHLPIFQAEAWSRGPPTFFHELFGQPF